MKIDHDLRQVIKAAHKHQRHLTHAEKAAAEARAIAKFLKARPITKREVTRLLKRKVKLANELAPIRKRIDAILHPLGLDDHYDGETLRLYSGYHTFTEAGGDLTEITHHEWEVDAVMAELAAADPKDARKILAKYGIRWE